MRRINDEYFGSLRLDRDEKQNLYILEREVQFVEQKKVTLYLENDEPFPNNKQKALYKLIVENAANIILKSEELYRQKFNTSLFAEFKIEWLTLRKDELEWELCLLKKSGFEHCIIEFQTLNPIHISFSA